MPRSESANRMINPKQCLLTVGTGAPDGHDPPRTKYKLKATAEELLFSGGLEWEHPIRMSFLPKKNEGAYSLFNT